MLADWPDVGIPNDEKLAFFKEARHAFGRTALLLSGGGGLGSFHLVCVAWFWWPAAGMCWCRRQCHAAPRGSPRSGPTCCISAPTCGVSPFCFCVQGVVKALFEHRMLPRVLAGSSVGSIIAGIVATRTDDELRETLAKVTIT